MVICKNCRKNEVSYDSPGKSDGLCKECYYEEKERREQGVSLVGSVRSADAEKSVEDTCFSLDGIEEQAKIKKEVAVELPECEAQEDEQRSDGDFEL